MSAPLSLTAMTAVVILLLSLATREQDPRRVTQILERIAASVPLSVRGSESQELFTRFASSVVLVVTEKSMSSGSVVDADGTILTSAHVVRHYQSVGVIFKAKGAGAGPRTYDSVRAVVVRVDDLADLALIKVASLPGDIRPLAIGDPAKVQVGQEVHAIGHPHMETWSHTKGVVTQVRFNHEWTSNDGMVRRADVVTTQTPINPGNSGGLLLNDTGELIGVNAFGQQLGAHINFAVATTDVRRVLAMTSDRRLPPPQTAANRRDPNCQPITKRTKRDEPVRRTKVYVDTNCDGRSDTLFETPDDKSENSLMMVDLNGNGKYETVYDDENHDNRYDYAYYDLDEVGGFDLIGVQLNDDLEPGRFLLPKQMKEGGTSPRSALGSRAAQFR